MYFIVVKLYPYKFYEITQSINIDSKGHVKYYTGSLFGLPFFLSVQLDLIAIYKFFNFMKWLAYWEMSTVKFIEDPIRIYFLKKVKRIHFLLDLGTFLTELLNFSNIPPGNTFDSSLSLTFCLISIIQIF